MLTIGQIVHQIRKELKAVNTDALLTDRYLFSYVQDYARTFIKRKDDRNTAMLVDSSFQTLPVELIPCEEGMRTKYKLPAIFEGPDGPLIKRVTSGDCELTIVDSNVYKLKTKKKSKYSKAKYGYFENGFIYSSDIDSWETIKVTAMFEEDITMYLEYDKYNPDNVDACSPIQDHKYNIPKDLISEIRPYILKELTTSEQLPSDPVTDKQSPLR